MAVARVNAVDSDDNDDACENDICDVKPYLFFCIF